MGRRRPLRQALDESTSGSLLTATYAGDGDRITKTDAVTGNHVYSYGLYDSYQQTYYTPRFQQRQSVQGPDRFFHADWLGSTRYMTNENGTAAPAMLRYDAYGNRSAWQGTDPAHPTDYQWAGGQGYMREADTSLGLDYLYQRYYDSSIGRFISRDPIRWAGGVNLYGYCGGDPVNRADPTGLFGSGAIRNRDDARALAAFNASAGSWLDEHVLKNPLVMGTAGGVAGFFAAGPEGAMLGAGLYGGGAEYRRSGDVREAIGTGAGAACMAGGAAQLGTGVAGLANYYRTPARPPVPIYRGFAGKQLADLGASRGAVPPQWAEEQRLWVTTNPECAWGQIVGEGGTVYETTVPAGKYDFASDLFGRNLGTEANEIAIPMELRSHFFFRDFFRAYPGRAAARKAIKAHARCSIPR